MHFAPAKKNFSSEKFDVLHSHQKFFLPKPLLQPVAVRRPPLPIDATYHHFKEHDLVEFCFRFRFPEAIGAGLRISSHAAEPFGQALPLPSESFRKQSPLTVVTR